MNETVGDQKSSTLPRVAANDRNRFSPELRKLTPLFPVVAEVEVELVTDHHRERLELAGSLQSYRRDGIGRTLFNVGDPVRAAGVVSRRDDRSIGVVHLLMPNGKELISGNREPRWTGNRKQISANGVLAPSIGLACGHVDRAGGLALYLDR